MCLCLLPLTLQGAEKIFIIKIRSRGFLQIDQWEVEILFLFLEIALQTEMN